MRVLQVLIAILFVALGMAFSALNADPVVIDLYFDRFTLSLGVVVLLAMLVGAILGGLAVLAGVVWPLQRQLRRSRSKASEPGAPAQEPLPPMHPPRS
ncbi:LapA family protein [Alkalisalibacterium limincola]|uniref:LapA family protein n=1 Tax=Alkalisalibacterium limincola TaxID=2699169 RepID=A0A5C8KUE7_9GAMM|nr:LapA family protein [Alkalisalibacterium limincola]TXK64541.1 LapA family protein [Alkalisalibacterium limincola]